MLLAGGQVIVSLGHAAAVVAAAYQCKDRAAGLCRPVIDVGILLVVAVEGCRAVLVGNVLFQGVGRIADLTETKVVDV